jgi:hypothetical protein
MKNQYLKILYFILIFILGVIYIFPQNIPNITEKIKKDAVIDYKIDLDKFPEISITLDLKEEAQIPVNLKKEDIIIKELVEGSSIEKEIQPENLQILDTYSIEKNHLVEKKGKIFSLLLDATLSLNKKDFETLKGYISDFIKQKNKKDIISLYSINGKAIRIQNFTNSEKNLLSKLNNITRKGKQTKLYDAIYTVLHDLHQYSKNKKQEIGGIVVFTDAKEETSILDVKDIEDLIIFGTKFEIPIFFVVIGNKKPIKSFEKISLKTGGELYLNSFEPKNILFKNQILIEEDLYVKKMRIVYQSTSKEIIFKYKSKIFNQVFYQNQKILDFQYEVKNKYLNLLIFFLIFLILILLSYFIWLFIKQKQKEKLLQQISNKEKIDFPEPEIGEIFADLRQYQDKPEKKYIESEEKPEIPLLAQNWVEPSYAPYLDDPLLRKKFSQETMTLSLKEKNYIVLQTALKEAPKYSHAMLVKKDREGLGSDKKFDLFLDEVYIGSSTAAHIPVRDPAISPIHAKIKRIDNKFILFDLMSVAGTYLNGKKVLRPMPLRHNDEIRMGHTIFRFVGEN